MPALLGRLNAEYQREQDRQEQKRQDAIMAREAKSRRAYEVSLHMLSDLAVDPIANLFRSAVYRTPTVSSCEPKDIQLDLWPRAAVMTLKYNCNWVQARTRSRCITSLTQALQPCNMSCVLRTWIYLRASSCLSRSTQIAMSRPSTMT